MFSEKRGNVLHGVLLIALFSCSAFYIAELLNNCHSVR